MSDLDHKSVSSTGGGRWSSDRRTVQPAFKEIFLCNLGWKKQKRSVGLLNGGLDVSLPSCQKVILNGTRA